MPIAGWKAMLLAVDEECGGHHTPWETDDVAYKTKAMAIEAAESWAEAEGLQFFDDCPNITEDAPDVSVKEQLVRIFGNDIGFVDLTPIKDLTCYQCEKPVKWLAPDSRCKDCTGYTPEDLV
jgi:hypothetical protein